MMFALGLGLLASLAFFVSATVYASVASFVGGLLAAWLVEDRNRGIGGLVLGIAGSYTLWGAYAVVQQVDACGNSCGGLSSPSLTAVIGLAFGVIALGLALAGYVAGRLVRRLVARQEGQPTS